MAVEKKGSKGISPKVYQFFKKTKDSASSNC